MSFYRKGIILAGGTGTRLYPITKSMNKQLLPVYNKPMIYYPLTTLMLMGIKEILIICNPYDLENFKNLLGDGSSWGLSIIYKVQLKPEGLAQAFIIADNFLEGYKSVLILGDNLFYGHDFPSQLIKASKQKEGGTIFAYQVNDPKRYGVVEFDKEYNALSLEEKPKKPKSKYAVTGIYLYDESVREKVTRISFSKRGELEITDLNKIYLKEKNLKVELLGRGITWLDTGTYDSLIEAGSFIKTIESKQGLMIGCPEEIAWRNKWINSDDLFKLSKKYKKSNYGEYLVNLLKNI
tara:strand:- start:168 stop:1049 length:882 start_codon:yes stop_codon:yes gene_type:complete